MSSKKQTRTEGFSLVVNGLKRKRNDPKRGDAKLVVGYIAPYAVYVHENTLIFHRNGQAKYLEQPLRQNRRKMAALVRSEMERGRSLDQALRSAGLALLKVSKELVPVDTGYLKSSGFIEIQ